MTTATAAPTAQQDRTPAQVLREAADLIEQEGWGQGAYYNPQDGCFCAVGAIGQVATGTPSHGFWLNKGWSVAEVLGDFIARQDGSPVNPVEWNDKEGQTAENVVQTMRDAADLWDSQQAHPAGKKLTPFCGVPTCGCDGTAHA